MKKTIRILLLCLLTSVASAGQLYKEHLTVANQSPATRKEAIKAALTNVLIRVSGNDAITTLPNIKNQMADPEQWVQEYRYIQTSPYAPLQLQVQFDAKAIDNIVTQAGQSIWGNSRPPMVAWIVIDDGTGDEFISASTDNAAAKALSQISDERGLALTLPLMDLQDIENVNAGNASVNTIQQFMNASARYPNKGIIIGAIKQLDGHWQGKWILIFASDVQTWDEKGDSSSAIIKDGINDIANSLAAKLAVPSHVLQKRTLQISVSNVHSVNDYKRLSKYLRHIDGVDDVQVVSVEPDQVSYNLQLATSVPAFLQAIGLGSVLTQKGTMTVDNETIQLQLQS